MFVYRLKYIYQRKLDRFHAEPNYLTRLQLPSTLGQIVWSCIKNVVEENTFTQA